MERLAGGAPPSPLFLSGVYDQSMQVAHAELVLSNICTAQVDGVFFVNWNPCTSSAASQKLTFGFCFYALGFI
ncbi:hypothetical protein J6590_084469 [Homalodisca vitripennis]|nr:hypothetical protein J6590_084469 [Homalodisca vitripennis]